MEPKEKKEHSPLVDVIGKQNWVTPDIQEFELKEATKSTIYGTGTDSIYNYS